MSAVKTPLPNGPERGGACPRAECLGELQEEHEGECCSCHISPPCGYCVSTYLQCDVCGWDERDYQ